MTKKQIRNYLKNAGIKGYSNAFICLKTKWVVTNELCGKFDDEQLELHNIDLSKDNHIVIKF